MTGFQAPLALLPVASHSQQNQSWVDMVQFLGTQFELLQHSRTVGVDQDVGVAEEGFECGELIWLFEVDFDAVLVAVHDVAVDGHGHVGSH